MHETSNPEYTFVEKVQAVVRKYCQFKVTGKSQRISRDTTTTSISFSMWKPCNNSSKLQNIWGTKGSVSNLWIKMSPRAEPSPFKTTTSATNSKRSIQRRPHSTIAAKSP